MFFYVNAVQLWFKSLRLPLQTQMNLWWLIKSESVSTVIRGGVSGYSLDVFPDGPEQVFPFPDGQEVAFSFVELVCVILRRNKLSKYEKASQTSKKINTEAGVCIIK